MNDDPNTLVYWQRAKQFSVNAQAYAKMLGFTNSRVMDLPAAELLELYQHHQSSRSAAEKWSERLFHCLRNGSRS